MKLSVTLAMIAVYAAAFDAQSFLAETDASTTAGSEQDNTQNLAQGTPGEIKIETYSEPSKVNDFEYWVNPESTTTLDAQKICEYWGGTLIMPKTEEEQQIVAGLNRHHNWPHWMGLYDKDVESKFCWQDGSCLSDSSYTNWMSHFPTGESVNTPNGRGDCVCFGSPEEMESKWFDFSCTQYKLPFICQRPNALKTTQVAGADKIVYEDVEAPPTKGGQGGQLDYIPDKFLHMKNKVPYNLSMATHGISALMSLQAEAGLVVKRAETEESNLVQTASRSTSKVDAKIKREHQLAQQFSDSTETLLDSDKFCPMVMGFGHGTC